MRIIIFLTLLCLFSKLHSQSWLQLTDFPGTERDDGTSFLINNKAYCFSGLEVGWQCTGNGYIFDCTSETWSSMANLPVGKERQYATAFSYNNKGYLFGGLKCDNTCFNDFLEYDPILNTWSVLPNFPGSARQGMGNFIIKNKAYIIGGRKADNTTLNEVWEYDFITTTWSQKNNLPIPIWRGSFFSIDSTGYVCYGMNSNSSYNHYVYQYNFLSDSWRKISNITLPAQDYIGTSVCNKKGCLYGGLDSTGIITNTLVVFNPLDSSLTNYSGIPSLGRKGSMFFSMNGALYITTGLNENQARIKETWKNIDFVGLKETEIDNSLLIYPNPTNSILNIIDKQNQFQNATIEIKNYLGQIVFESHFNNQVNLLNLSNGMYFLSIRHKEQIKTIKFIKE
ncbi:MAG TPA: kelch repeat-containing protein [Bacteroidia bacterium]|nr:kelch repeat-containing protein [Bacteroidia bacterium]